MKLFFRIKRVKNLTKKAVGSIKNLICKKYIYVVGWSGVLFSSNLNRFVTLEESPLPLVSKQVQVIQSVQYACLSSQLENEVDLQKRDQDGLEIQTGSGITLIIHKNVQLSQ